MVAASFLLSSLPFSHFLISAKKEDLGEIFVRKREGGFLIYISLFFSTQIGMKREREREREEKRCQKPFSKVLLPSIRGVRE